MERMDAMSSWQDLHMQLVGRIAILVAGISGAGAWLLLPRQPFPAMIFGLLLLATGFALLLRFLSHRHQRLTPALLVWVPVAILLLAIWFDGTAWLPMIALVLILIGGVLLPGTEIVIACTVVAFSLWMNLQMGRSYPIVPLAMVLFIGAAVVWLTMRTLYTALNWVGQAQKRANKLLAETRTHRSQLSRTLQSAEIANTRLRRVERELTIAKAEADEARRSKEQFAANVSHELRTPLNLILGFSEMMYLSPEIYGPVNWTPSLRRDTYQIYRNGRHLLEMIDDILALSQFDIAGFTLHKELTNLSALLHSTVEIARDLFRTTPVALELHIAPELPMVEIDQTRIRQVLLNLLNNALRFTAEGTVQLCATATDREVVIQVIDTGPGIPEEHQSHIFREFYQVDLSLRRSHSGAGLGLAICRQFVQAHDGRIWVESKPGQGSTFTFTLPIPEKYVPLSHLMLVPATGLSEMSVVPVVMVVDPDPAVAAIVRRYIQDVEIQHVANAADLPSLVETVRPQAVIYNHSAQGHTAIPQLPPGLPFIECVLPSRTWIMEALDVDGWLAKPLTAQQLLKEIARLEEASDRRFESILVVDDDRGFCQLITRFLESSGHPAQVRRAFDGEEALQILHNEPADLLLLDLVMPNTDGFSVLAEIKRLQMPDLSILLVTATDFRQPMRDNRDASLVVRRLGNVRPDETLRWIAAIVHTLAPQTTVGPATVAPQKATPA